MGPGDSEQANERGLELCPSEDSPDRASGEAGRAGQPSEGDTLGKGPGNGSLVGRLALAAIGAYQKTVKYRPPVCRFRPSCSEYSRQAIVKYGFLKGSAMGAWRICGCNRWCLVGHDPVP